jgi:hypothetical protein
VWADTNPHAIYEWSFKPQKSEVGGALPVNTDTYHGIFEMVVNQMPGS